jgi:hypothetical protein
MFYMPVPGGKARSFDHPSPEYGKLFKHQITRPFALSIRIGPKWSRGPFFPVKGIGFSNLANKLNVR